MPIASLTSIAVNKSEYSKFETNNAIIETVVFLTGTVTAGLADSTLRFEIRKARRNRDVVVYTLDVDVATYFNLAPGDDVPDLPLYAELDTRLAVSVPDLINLIRRGEYYVKVYRSDEVAPFLVAGSLDSENFYISPITVNRMKSDWCFGIDFQSSDIRTWRFQPRLITGVTVTEVSRNHKLSFFPLTYTRDPVSGSAFLSWDSGKVIPLVPGYKEFMLPAGGPSSEYIIVKVDFNRIPAINTQEEMCIEEKVMDEVTIRRYIHDSIDHAENTLLQVYIEPTELVTDIDPSQLTYAGAGGALVINDDYDFITSPVTFYPRTPGQWIDIQFPFPSLLRIDQLYGAVANTRVVSINTEWIETAEKSGYTQLVPFNTELAFDFIGLVWVESLRSATPIPNFWHYNLLAGLRNCPGDVLELIGRHAAIPILTAAGAAFRGGYSSQSISRDGVSESVSYTSSAIYGIYSASIEDYRNWIREHLPAIRSRYRGPQMIVM